MKGASMRLVSGLAARAHAPVATSDAAPLPREFGPRLEQLRDRWRQARLGLAQHHWEVVREIVRAQGDIEDCLDLRVRQLDGLLKEALACDALSPDLRAAILAALNGARRTESRSARHRLSDATLLNKAEADVVAAYRRLSSPDRTMIQTLLARLAPEPRITGDSAP